MTARGIRNNNPGNIKANSIQWTGLAQQQSDPTFFVFSEMKYGCRALLRLISTYYRLRGCNSIRSIINRYAPPEENNTDSYVNHVAKLCNVSPDEFFELTKEMHLNIAKAIAKHENGADANTITNNTWEEAYKLV